MYTIKLNIGSWSSPVLGDGYVLANPIKDNVVIARKRDDEFKQVTRTTINGEFIFYDNNTNDEFTKLKQLLDSEDVFVECKIYFNNSERLSGIINLNTGTWDENKKRTSLLFQPSDEYTAIYQRKNEEFNIKDAGVNSVKMAYKSKLFVQESNVTTKSWTDYQKTTSPDPLLTTSVRATEWDLYSLISTSSVPGGFVYTYSTNVLPFYKAGYAFNIYLRQQALAKSVVYYETETDDLKYYCNNSTTEELVEWIDFTEFVKLYDLIEYMLNDINSSISISESTYATYLTVDNPEYINVMLSDKSDVKRWDASNKSKYENISFSDLMNNIKSIFNLDWTIVNNVFKLVRPEDKVLPSFTTLPNHDFTTINNGSSIVNNQQRYKFNINKKVNSELWTFEPSYLRSSTATISKDNLEKEFVTTKINYGSKDEESKENKLTNYNNNILYLKNNPEEADDSGLTLITVDFDATLGNIISYTEDSSLEFYAKPIRINPYFTSDYLVKLHHLVDKQYVNSTIEYSELFIIPSLIGLVTRAYIDRVGTYTLEKEPDKEVVFTNVPILDIDDIDFNYLVKTDFGNVSPESVEINLSLKNFATFKGVF